MQKVQEHLKKAKIRTTNESRIKEKKKKMIFNKKKKREGSMEKGAVAKKYSESG